MTDREALLRAVCDNPDEDTPRLVFADWLQENGEEDRAEFIRVQIELARGNATPTRHERERALFAAHRAEWLKALPAPNPAHIDWMQWGSWLGGEEFDRGFPTRLRVTTAGSLFVYAGRLFGATPVRRLMVHHIMRADKLAKISQLRHLHTFRLTFPKFGGVRVSGVDSDQGVHRCLVPVRHTRPSSSSRP